MERQPQLAPLLPTMRLDELLHELDSRLTDVVRTRDRLHELLNAVLAVGSDLDLQTMLRRIVEASVRLVDAEYGALGVIGSNGFLAQFLTSGVDDEQHVRIGHLPRGHGILGVLIRDPRPLRLDDLGSHPAAYGFPPNHPPMRTFLGVPIRVREEVFGNLYLTEKRGGASFDEEDEAVVLALAAAAGVAIENARLYEDTRRREQWVAASGEISTALLSGRQAEDVLPLLATRAAELADATTALVALPHDGQDGLVVEVATGPDSSSLVGRRLGQLGSRGAAARRSPEPEAEAEPEVEAGSEVEVLAAADGPYEVCEGLVVGSAVVVPLGTADGGVLVVGSSTDAEPVRAGSVSALRTFAAQAALALELAARRRDAERLIVFEDRDRIARDLHDVVIQRLFATGMQLESTTRLLTAPEAKARVRQAVDNLDATIREIRSSIYALQTGPSSDAAPTLRSRLLEVLDAAAEQLGFSPTLQLTGLVDTGVPADIGEQVLAVLREALSNAARHANATRVVVQVDVGAKALRLAVRDNGVGIAETTRRSGLANLSGRAAALGGSFSVEPLGGPEGGTELIWSVPLET